MKVFKSYSVIVFPFIVLIFIFSCSDDDSVNGQNECKILIEGNVTDLTNGQLIDAVKVRLSPNIILGQPSPVLLDSDQGYTDLGQYSLELNCKADLELYHMDFVDNEQNRYYHRNFRIHLSDEDHQKDVMMCPAAFLQLELENRSYSDSIVYKLSGFQCDNAELEIGFYTWRNYSSDTTDVLKLPESSELEINIRSYKDGIEQKDTIAVFSTTEGDTTSIELRY